MFLSQKYLIFCITQNIVSLLPKTTIKVGHNIKSNFLKVPESNKNKFFTEGEGEGGTIWENGNSNMYTVM